MGKIHCQQEHFVCDQPISVDIVFSDSNRLEILVISSEDFCSERKILEHLKLRFLEKYPGFLKLVMSVRHVDVCTHIKLDHPDFSEVVSHLVIYIVMLHIPTTTASKKVDCKSCAQLCVRVIVFIFKTAGGTHSHYTFTDV